MDRNHLNVILLTVIIAFQHGANFKSIKKGMMVKDHIFVDIVITSF